MAITKSKGTSRTTSSNGSSPFPPRHPQPITIATPPQSHMAPPTATAAPAVPTSTTTPAVSNNLPTGPNIFYNLPSDMKPRVYRSDIWEHFTTYWVRSFKKVKNEEIGQFEDVVVYKERAKCKYCPKGQGDYATESGPNGTSGLKKHISKLCKWYPANSNLQKQKVLTWDKGDYNQLTSKGFNQKEIMEACVEMVVLDELPFSFVEKRGFRKFCMTGMPLFKVPSRRTLVRNFLDMYQDRKMILKKELASHRICLTTNTLTSVQNNNYMMLTAHFIDSDWKLHKRVLNFCIITNHEGVTIANLIQRCLNDWGITKVLTITVDNASANKVALEVLTEKLNDCENPQTILGGKHMYVRCVAHITNLIVGNGLKTLNPTILAIRNAVKFVRSSPNRLELFRKAVARENIGYKGLVCLDVPTRWNTTYMMLESALRFKKAFKRMEQEVDSSYVAYFNEPEEEFDEDGNVIVQKNDKKKVGPPCEVDWDACQAFVDILQVFYVVTLRVSASLHPTIHTTFHDIVQMEETMNQLFNATGLQSSTDKLMADIGAIMKTKYNRYFGFLKDLNPFIILSLVLDPRFKLKHISQLLIKDLQWANDEVKEKESEIKDLLFQLYEEYEVDKVDKNVKRTSSNSLEAISSSTDLKRQRVDETNRISSSIGMKYVMNWNKHVGQADEAVILHEIVRYLKDPVLAIMNKTANESTDSKEVSEPSEEELAEKYRSFDILQWWKQAACQYPVLALIAKDIFAIQVSTVASESAFSIGGKVIDSFRSSLTPTSLEALICMQNWLRGDDITMDFEDEPTVEELEFYEDIETELFNAKAAAASGTNNKIMKEEDDPEEL